MRYMFLIYTKEDPTRQMPEAEMNDLRAAHWNVMQKATAKGVFRGAEPLQQTTTATTVRMQDGKPVTIDGPFAETKEALAGYYILDCADLDEAIEWASQIKTACGGGGDGCVEIRPMRLYPRAEAPEVLEHAAASLN